MKKLLRFLSKFRQRKAQQSVRPETVAVGPRKLSSAQQAFIRRRDARADRYAWSIIRGRAR